MNRTRRVVFCVTARSGLGHLRRVTNVAGALRGVENDITQILLTNAPPAGLGEAERHLFDHVRQVERKRMAYAAAAFSADVIVVDTAIVPGLELLPGRLCLILRETVPSKLREFRLAGARKWDQIIVPNPRSDWRPAPIDVGGHAIDHVGWIFRGNDPSHSYGVLRRSSPCAHVLATTGGGGGAAAARAAMDDVLIQARHHAGNVFRVIEATGPRSTARLANADDVVTFGSALNQAFQQADVILSTAGYNAVLEIAATDTPALLFPIERTFDDQFARARRWGDRLGLDHETGNTERSANWLANVVTLGQRRMPANLGESGCRKAAEHIARLLLGAPAEARFAKTLKPEHVPYANRIARNSLQLMRAGCPTPPLAEARGGQSMQGAHISGATARALLAEARPDTRSESFAGIEGLLAHAMQALAALHDAPLPRFDVGRADPWRRIDPRLTLLASQVREGSAAWADAVKLLVRRQKQLHAGPVLKGSQVRLLHNDFHCGQLICPEGCDRFVIVDLDDLASGPVESDIANFAAHFVTSHDLFRGNPDTGFENFARLCADAYRSASGREPCAARLAYFGSISLVRRSLKLLEHGALGPSLRALAITAERLFEDARSLLRKEQSFQLRQSLPPIGQQQNCEVAVET